MVEIQCPHCDEVVELEDGVFGLFECPHCENEFEFEDESPVVVISNKPRLEVPILLVLSFLLAIGAGIVYFATVNGTVETQQCDDCSWEEDLAQGVGGGLAEGAGKAIGYTVSSCCMIFSGVLLITAFVTFMIQPARD
jgi:hypothetical protein